LKQRRFGAVTSEYYISVIKGHVLTSQRLVEVELNRNRFLKAALAQEAYHSQGRGAGGGLSPTPRSRARPSYVWGLAFLLRRRLLLRRRQLLLLLRRRLLLLRHLRRPRRRGLSAL
jgi:hypothetical protein